MTHRSPLVTLAGLVVAFALFFGINIASSAPRQATGPEYSSPSPSASATAEQSGAAASPTPSEQSTRSASSSPTGTSKGDQFPDKVVYAGRTDDKSAAIAVAVLGDQAAAYLCDGRNVESWLRGTAEDGELKLRAKNGDRLEATLNGSKITGEIEVGDEKLEFTIGEAKRPSGLYRARGSDTTIGWIVLPDGSQVGIQTSNGESEAAPTLDPDQPDVDAGGEQVSAKPVEGDEDLQ